MLALVALPFTLALKTPSIGLLIGNRHILDDTGNLKLHPGSLYVNASRLLTNPVQKIFHVMMDKLKHLVTENGPA